MRQFFQVSGALQTLIYAALFCYALEMRVLHKHTAKYAKFSIFLYSLFADISIVNVLNFVKNIQDNNILWSLTWNVCITLCVAFQNNLPAAAQTNQWISEFPSVPIAIFYHFPWNQWDRHSGNLPRHTRKENRRCENHRHLLRSFCFVYAEYCRRRKENITSKGIIDLCTKGGITAVLLFILLYFGNSFLSSLHEMQKDLASIRVEIAKVQTTILTPQQVEKMIDDKIKLL